MLVSLHVRNLALIEEEEVTFTDGLNILTGETGAGKSVIIGSINLALGAKADKAIIRTGAEYALIEMMFSVDNEGQLDKLQALDLPTPEDGIILIKRKIMPNRSVCSVCGETVTLKQLREISESLIDIYGQRENQKLLRADAQLQTIDDYAGETAANLKAQIQSKYSLYRELFHQWENDDMDEAARKREIDLLAYEIGEIEEAALTEGEDEQLEEQYRRMGNFRKISESAGGAYEAISGADSAASEQISRACRELSAVSGLDKELDDLSEQLGEIDSLLSDFDRALGDYMRNLSFDTQEFEDIQDRLNLINRLKDKYGRSLALIEREREKRVTRLEFLQDYEEGRRQLFKRLQKEKEELLSLCAALSEIRHRAAEEFAEKLRQALLELNFLQVEFSAEIVSGEDHLGAGGYDKVRFFISMNPGESPRPLEQIASGGELSRIMLGLKTVFAGKEEVHSFVFDEIDTGISGQTAWKVSQKMGKLARNHQILCITHLPQIAAMEDSHYMIAKESREGRTVTHISRLSESESDRELARLLGGDVLTEASLGNAREMKQMAAQEKIPH